MLQLLSPDTHLVRDRGPFRLRRIRPGLVFGPEGDTGFGGLGLIDHAQLSPGLVVSMHEHRNDEIVSYLRTGAMGHTDTAGTREMVSPDRLMVMNSGTGFWHEERVPVWPVEMLQIFIRPSADDLPPGVQFQPLDGAVSENAWRRLAGPVGSAAPTTVRQQVHLFDARLSPGGRLGTDARPGFDSWLYVFSGRVTVGGHELAQHWALAAVGEPLPDLEAVETSDLVLFLVDRSAPASRSGTLSG